MRTFLITVVTLISLFQNCLYGQVAFERAGNIFMRGVDGSERQITTSGQDSDPSLSADRSEVIFVRLVKPERGLEGPATEIWAADTVGGSTPSRILAGQIRIRDAEYESFSSPQLSLDGKFVFFDIPCSATSGCIVRLDRSTGETKLIASAIRFNVLHTGGWKGYIIALQRQSVFRPVGFIEHWYWLLNPDGEQVGYIGQTEREVQDFLEEHQN